MTERKDVWASGDAYEPYVGRWSRLIARQFIAWLRVPRDKVWLDIGCGTGVLSQVILDNASPQHVAGVDPSDGFVAFARHKVTNPRATFQVGDAQNLPVADNSFDATVAGLVIKFRSRSGKSCTRNGASDALWRHHRCIRLGLCWQMMRRFWDAAVALDPSAISLDEGRRFPVCRPEPLASLFQHAGLGGAEVRSIDAATIFKDFDDYWTPFLGGQAPAPGYCIVSFRRSSCRIARPDTCEPSDK